MPDDEPAAPGQREHDRSVATGSRPGAGQSRRPLETLSGAHAEMENLRKRTERDVQNAHNALERFFSELLPVRWPV